MFLPGTRNALVLRVEVYGWHVREKSVAVVRRQVRGTQHSSIFIQDTGFLAFHDVGVLGAQVGMAVVSCMEERRCN
jgi:hypothetical protein